MIRQKMKRACICNREAYLRKMATDGYIVHLDLSDISSLISLLRNISNNINQIAKRVNETRHIYEADISDLKDHYDLLWEKTNDILMKLAQL